MNRCNLGRESRAADYTFFSNSVVDLAVIVITVVTDVVVERDFGSTLKKPTYTKRRIGERKKKKKTEETKHKEKAKP